MKYQTLLSSLSFQTAIEWMPIDSADDFFPDPIGWADIRQFPNEYLANRKHRLLQYDTLPHIIEHIPKKSGMLREAVWLHPTHRILYLSILHRFLPRLDSRLCSEAYSYRLDSLEDTDKYPFSQKMDRWKNFHNEFRRAALEESTGAILITDLASYFDHIQIDKLALRINSILGSTIDENDQEVINLLVSLLKMWGHEGFGMPQNYDSSSFFGSVYLHNVDCEMVSKRYRYFRWIDDIRIVTRSKEQALRALHDLQHSLAQQRLFLATDKTFIYEKGSDEFNELLNVDDDILLSEAEEIIVKGDKTGLESVANDLFYRLEFHSKPKGDERKFRAFANRLLDISDFVEIEKNITSRIHDFVIPRLKTYPERSDYWTKMLSVRPTPNVGNVLKDLLIKSPSMFDWKRFYLWKLATAVPASIVPQELFEKAKEVRISSLSDNVTSQCIVFIGRHSDNTSRENLFTSLFSAQKSYIIQRAILIAIQELPSRDYYYDRALEINSSHKELIDYLKNRPQPDYGIKERTMRHCLEEPITFKHIIKKGIGLSKGKIRTFRISRYDYDY